MSELKKAWKLIDQLEKDNYALTIAARNSMSAQNGFCTKHVRTIGRLTTTNKQLETDNKFLKQMVLKANSLSATELKILLADLRNKPFLDSYIEGET